MSCTVSTLIPTGAGQGAASRGPVRLTRRGRVLLLGMLIAVVLSAFSLGRAGSQAATSAAAAPVLVQTTVHRGETLWAVARRIAPHNDPREVVQQLRVLNHLERSSLQAGQQLLLPRSA